MSYIAITLDSDILEYPPEKFPELINEVKKSYNPEDYVSIKHESGWIMSLYSDGYLVFEDPEKKLGTSRYLSQPTDEKVLELWQLLALGHFKELDRISWLDGNPVYGEDLNN